MTALTKPETTLTVREDSPVAVLSMLAQAVERGASVESLERLEALYERMERRQAEKDCNAAMARFQAKIPPIPKTGVAQQVSKTGGTRVLYTFAELDTIAETVGPLLHAEGFSYGWDVSFGDGMLHVTCTLRHANGHALHSQFTVPVEKASDLMNKQQAHGAALTYARRYSLIAVLGLTTTEPDTDASEAEPVSAEQAMQLKQLYEASGMSPKQLGRLFAVLGVEARDDDAFYWEDVPKDQYAVAVRALEKK